MRIDKLTNSATACAKTCLRKFQYRFVIGFARLKTSGALRIGGAVHRGCELWHKGTSPAEAIQAAMAGYINCPEWIELEQWLIEAVTVRALLRAYFDYYAGDQLEFLAVETPFCLPLENPNSTGKSKTFDRAGKIDAIVKWEDRVVLFELKTTSDSIDAESDYWQRLRIDPQPSGYILAARSLGYNIQSAIYSTIHKPSIRPQAIPLLDEDKVKIVLNSAGERVKTKDGRKWRETGDSALGYTLQTRPETPEEFEERLYQDCKNRPVFYFARREIPRLESDLDEYRAELWQIGQLIIECNRRGLWFRSVSKANCTGCEYFPLCSNNVKVDPEHLPDGYQSLSSISPELEEASI